MSGSIVAFAICRAPGDTNAVRRLVFTEAVQQMIEAMLTEQRENFVASGLTRVPFDPTYSTHDGSVLCIEGFELPEHVREAISTPREVPEFQANDSTLNVKAAFYVESDGNVYFQCWRNFTVLDRRKIWLLLDGRTFDLGEESRSPLVLKQARCEPRAA